MPVRSSLGMSSQFTPKLSNPLFSPAAHGPDSHPPSAAPPDERPPLESILDGAVGDGAAATASARPAAPPVESADGFWVTVFGYHTPAMVPQVLQELRPSSGTIAQHRAGVGAWLHVRYTEWHQQQEALAKNGRVRHRAHPPHTSYHRTLPTSLRSRAGPPRLHARRDRRDRPGQLGHLRDARQPHDPPTAAASTWRELHGGRGGAPAARCCFAP